MITTDSSSFLGASLALVLAEATLRPTLDLTSFSLAETMILPSFSSALYDQSESRPGESSMSPVQTLKQAACQITVIVKGVCKIR